MKAKKVAVNQGNVCPSLPGFHPPGIIKKPGQAHWSLQEQTSPGYQGCLSKRD